MPALNLPASVATAPAPAAQRRRDLFLIVCVGLVTGLPFLWQNYNWSRREVRHAVIAAEMAERNEYLVPHHLGELYQFKPPVVHAEMAVYFKLFGGPSMFLARLPSLLASILAALAVYGLGRVLISRKTGLFAACAMLAVPGIAKIARIAGPDMTFTAALLLMSLGLAAGLGADQMRRRLAYAFLGGLAGGVAWLTKGPYGIAFIGLFTLFTLIFAPLQARDSARFRDPADEDPAPNLTFRGVVPAALLFTLGLFLIPGTWVLVLQARGDTEYLHRLFHQYDPATDAHIEAFYWYLGPGCANLIPWLLFIPLGLLEWKKFRWLLLMVLALFLVFSAIPGKAERYLSPWFCWAMLALCAPIVARERVPWLRATSRALLILMSLGVVLYQGVFLPLRSPVNEDLKVAVETLEALPDRCAILCYKGKGEEVAWQAYQHRPAGAVLVGGRNDGAWPLAWSARQVLDQRTLFVLVNAKEVDDLRASLPGVTLEEVREIEGLPPKPGEGAKAAEKGSAPKDAPRWVLFRAQLDETVARGVDQSILDTVHGADEE